MKSKGRALILSIIPGGGHFYLGLYNRGFLFLAGIILLLTRIFGISDFFEGVVPILWIYCAIDACKSTDDINSGRINLEEEMNFSKRDKDLLGVLLSTIPGLGHMYEGHSRKGSNLLMVFVIVVMVNLFVDSRLGSMFMYLLVIYTILDLLSIREGKSFRFDISKSQELNLTFKIAAAVMIVSGLFKGINIASQYIVDPSYGYIITIASLCLKSAILVVIGIILLFKTRKK